MSDIRSILHTTLAATREGDLPSNPFSPDAMRLSAPKSPEIVAISVSKQLPEFPNSGGGHPILCDPAGYSHTPVSRDAIPLPSAIQPTTLDALAAYGPRIPSERTDERQPFSPLQHRFADARHWPQVDDNAPPPKPRAFDFEIEIVALAEAKRSRTTDFELKWLHQDEVPVCGAVHGLQFEVARLKIRYVLAIPPFLTVEHASILPFREAEQQNNFAGTRGCLYAMRDGKFLWFLAMVQKMRWVKNVITMDGNRTRAFVLFHSSLVESGKALTPKGLQVIAHVGMETMELLTSATGIEVEKQSKEADLETAVELYKAATFDQCFYIFGGPEQLDELEAVSHHYNLLFNRRKTKFSSAHKPFDDAAVQQVRQIFSRTTTMDAPIVTPDTRQNIEPIAGGRGDEMKALGDASVNKAAAIATGLAAALGAHISAWLLMFGVAVSGVGRSIRQFSSAVAAEELIKSPVHLKLLNGQFVDAASGKTFPTLDTSSGEMIAEVSRNVNAARKAFDEGPWPRMIAYQGSTRLYCFADWIAHHTEKFAPIESWHSGKPYNQSALVGIRMVTRLIRHDAGWADKIQGLVVPTDGPYHVQVLHESIGVAGQILPWNFCSPTGSALASPMDVAKIDFTGSTHTGRIGLESAAKSHLKSVTLELGGKSPFIVFDNADIDGVVVLALCTLFQSGTMLLCCFSYTCAWIQPSARASRPTFELEGKLILQEGSDVMDSITSGVTGRRRG